MGLETTLLFTAAEDSLAAAWISAIATMLAAAATVVAALLVSVTGGLIAGRFALLRDRQEKETRWRDQALELTKLDLERKLKMHKPDDEPLRPSILDFLANYRDLCELEDKVRKGQRSPAELYVLIQAKRVTDREKKPRSEPPGTPGSPPRPSATEAPPFIR